jgi:hypothetical protein
MHYATTHEFLMYISSEIISIDEQIHEVILALTNDVHGFKVLSSTQTSKHDILKYKPENVYIVTDKVYDPPTLEAMERLEQVFCHIGFTNLVRGKATV